MRFREVRRREIEEIKEVKEESIFPEFFEKLPKEEGFKQIKPETNITHEEAVAFWNDVFSNGFPGDDVLPDEIVDRDGVDELPDEIVDRDGADDLPDEITLDDLSDSEEVESEPEEPIAEIKDAHKKVVETIFNVINSEKVREACNDETLEVSEKGKLYKTIFRYSSEVDRVLKIFNEKIERGYLDGMSNLKFVTYVGRITGKVLELNIRILRMKSLESEDFSNWLRDFEEIRREVENL